MPFFATDPREGPLRPPKLLIALAMTVAALGACDRLGEIVILPEIDQTFSFEGGLEGWIPGGIDLDAPASSWMVDTSGEVTSTGSAAARFHLDNQSGSGKIWVTRAFEVEPERSYSIEVQLDVASADTADPWRLLVSAHTEIPAAAGELVVQDATEIGDGSYDWATRTYTVQGTADDEGNLVILLGFWGTSAGERTYYLDNVRLLFTRMDVTG